MMPANAPTTSQVNRRIAEWVFSRLRLVLELALIVSYPPGAGNGSGCGCASGCCRRRSSCLRANGFAETTIDQIAERADVARQTVLNHFPHKTDFAKAWGQRRRDQLAAIGVGSAGDESARTVLRRSFAAAAEMNERERDLTRAMLGSLTPTEVFLYVRAVPAAVIERGQAQGEFSSDGRSRRRGRNPHLGVLRDRQPVADRWPTPV